METLELQQTSDLQVIAKKIDAGLIAFENRKHELTELKSESNGLKIESIEDRATIAQVSTIRKKLKSARVEITKEGKAMRDPLTLVSRMISEKEKELIDIIEPTERELQAQEKWVEDEKDRIRQEEIRVENERIQKRIDALALYGFQIDYADIKQMGEETFSRYLEAAKAQYEKEQAEKAEAERLRIEQEQKEQLEREAEQKRIAAEREELERLRKESAEREAKLRADQERIEAERRHIEEEKNRIAREKELAEARAKAAEEARIRAIEEARIEAERKKEAEQKAKEAAERKAARQPDKVKLKAYIDAIKAVPAPEMKTTEGKGVLFVIQDLINRFPTHLETL